jgi:hypothetical protein
MIIYAIQSSIYQPPLAYFLNKKDADEAVKRIEYADTPIVEIEVLEQSTPLTNAIEKDVV